jgi:hypothetical protein
MRRFWVLALAAGCSFGDGPTDGSIADTSSKDAGRRDASEEDASETDAEQPGAKIEVGTGSDQFTPLVEGQTVEFTPGFQGGGRYMGFHIYTGARAWDLNPDAASIDFIVLLASDRSELGRTNWVTNFRPTTSDAYEIWGGTPRLNDCCLAVGQPLILRVEVLDADGVSGSGEIEVLGDAMCDDFTGNVCP